MKAAELQALAERKLGPNVKVSEVRGEWVAERIFAVRNESGGTDTLPDGTVRHSSKVEERTMRKRVTARDRDTFIWFLEQLPDFGS